MWPHVLSGKSCRICWINLNILDLLLDKDCRSAYPQDIAHGLEPRESLQHPGIAWDCSAAPVCTQNLYHLVVSESPSTTYIMHCGLGGLPFKHSLLCLLCPSWTSNRPLTSLTLQTGIQAIAQRHCETRSGKFILYIVMIIVMETRQKVFFGELHHCNTRKIVLCNDPMRPVRQVCREPAWHSKLSWNWRDTVGTLESRSARGEDYQPIALQSTKTMPFPDCKTCLRSCRCNRITCNEKWSERDIKKKKKICMNSPCQNASATGNHHVVFTNASLQIHGLKEDWDGSAASSPAIWRAGKQCDFNASMGKHLTVLQIETGLMRTIVDPSWVEPFRGLWEFKGPRQIGCPLL